jgi:hypothetical protein
VEYIEDQVREKILNEIKYLELPHEWKPNEVINYIYNKLNKGSHGIK